MKRDPEGIQIKPDMNKEEKLREQVLLKERWSLICSGTDKKHIKIRRAKLYVKGQIYGEVINSTFIPNPITESLNSSSDNSTTEVGNGSTSNNDTPTYYVQPFTNKYRMYRP